MKKKIIKLAVFWLLIALLSASESFSLTIGDMFPDFSTAHRFAAKECDFFGIECEKDFSLDSVRCDVLIIEFLNVYCHTCRVQVPVYNEVLEKIKADHLYAKRVCILGIAVGNTDAEIADFRNNYSVKYPVIPDTEKEIFYQTGNIQGTPHTYVLMRDGDRFFIVDYHSGSSSAERYLKVLNRALRESIVGVEPGNIIPEFSFKADGILYNNDNFSDKRFIMYLPVDKAYPLDIDTRNPGIQMDILFKILKRFSKVEVIVVPFKGMNVADIKHERLYYAEMPEALLVEKFGSVDSPAIYMVNPFGRISFKGESITLNNCEDIIKGREYVPQVDLSDDEIIKIIEDRITASGDTVISTEPLIMDNSNTIFATAVEPRNQGVYYFSFVASKPSLCDICHDSHFIYMVDSKGVIKDFIPLKLTKLGNIVWSEDDNMKIRNDFSGKSIFRTFTFNPKVDAVTTSTMSSGLVYEAFNEAKDVFADFKEYGFRSEYWKELCHRNICLIKEKTGENIESQQQLEGAVLEHNLSGCPQGGLYIAVDGDILCSIHGLVFEGCK